MELSHTDKEGKPRMVDVSGKPVEKRIARATGFIKLNTETIRLISTESISKGNVLLTAQIAGIQAAKKTAELIPLCHPLDLKKIDVDLETRFPDGAEDTYYLGLEPAYRTANRLMASPSELLLLREVTLEDYLTLLPHVSALPTATPININSATPEVLTSITEGLSLVQMQSIADARDKDPFDDVDELLSNTLFAGKEIPDTLLSVSSNYFILRGEARIGHIRQKLNVVYERDAEGRIYSLMRAQGEI